MDTPVDPEMESWASAATDRVVRDEPWDDVDEDVRREQDNNHAAELMAEMYDNMDEGE